MAKIPSKTTEPDSARDIEKYARRLLRAADVGNRLPTPQEDILKCRKLVLSGGIDLDAYAESKFRKKSRALISGIGKIMGILDFRDKTVIISPDVPETRKLFVTFHEISHDMLPWQVDTYIYFADSNEALRPDIEWKYEKEANFGSVQLLFQCGRFQKEAREYELSLRTGRKLKQDYGTSYHSTFWNYVETNSKSCVLLIMRQCNYAVMHDGNMELPYRLLYPVASEKFIDEFGGMSLPDLYYSDHPFIQTLDDPNVDSSEVYDGEISLKNRNDEKIATRFEAWTNSYNLFILIWKKPKFQMRKKRVLFSPES